MTTHPKPRPKHGPSGPVTAAAWATPARTRTGWLALALLVIAAAVDLFNLLQAREEPQPLQDCPRSPGMASAPGEGRDGAASSAMPGCSARGKAASPVQLFVQAQSLAASGAAEDALDRYRALQSDSPLGQAARYNAANLLVRQAIGLRESQQPAQALPLLELAKETYREVLRHDPLDWEARYNLERAQRLQPDADDVGTPPAGPPEQSERAATTMRGYSPGLP